MMRNTTTAPPGRPPYPGNHPQGGNARAHANFNGNSPNPFAGGRGTIRPGQSAVKFKGVLQFTIAVLVAAVPISFYLVQPDRMQNAVASGTEKEKDISNIISNLGTSIKETVFGEEGAVVQMKPSQTGGSQANNLQGSKPMQVAQAPSESAADALNDTALEHASKHAKTNYVCPMHPDVITDEPNAICPICGMDLVVLEAGGESGAVKLTPTVINTLGVRTEKAKVRTLYRKINSVGYVEMDEGKLRSINLRVEGWIEKLYAKAEGERVEKGQPLFELYSPKLVNAQEEYVQAVQHENELLLKATRDRLMSLGISKEQIDALKSEADVKQHITFTAPQNGFVSKLSIREGMHVMPSTMVMEIADLGTVWLIAEIFESQADWVKIDQKAEATLPYSPGKIWEGKVDYIYPSLDAKTRSLKVRLQFENTEESLKPNMYADVSIFAKPKRKVLTIPREALIITGSENRVIVAMGEGKFIPMSVKVGIQTDRSVEILSGLGEGDDVVTSSQFLIDSESNLKASLARMLGHK